MVSKRSVAESGRPYLLSDQELMEAYDSCRDPNARGVVVTEGNFNQKIGELIQAKKREKGELRPEFPCKKTLARYFYHTQSLKDCVVWNRPLNKTETRYAGEQGLRGPLSFCLTTLEAHRIVCTKQDMPKDYKISEVDELFDGEPGFFVKPELITSTDEFTCVLGSTNDDKNFKVLVEREDAKNSGTRGVCTTDPRSRKFRELQRPEHVLFYSLRKSVASFQRAPQRPCEKSES